MDYLKENSKIWDDRSANADRWSVPVSSEEVALARQGEWSILLTPTKPVPRDWFPQELAGKNVLCLASGGGQIDAGFAIVGFYEDRGGPPLDNFMSGSIATKAVKL